MKNKLFLLALMAVYAKLSAQSPHHCATDSLWKSDSSWEYKQAMFAAELAEFRTKMPFTGNYYLHDEEPSPQGITPGCRNAILIVPVVVHIDTTAGIVNVSDTQVHQQIAILNDRFDDARIRFVLAGRLPNGSPFSGIRRFAGNFDYRYDKLANGYASSPTHYFNPLNYFNIYVTPNILASDSSASPIAGFNNVFADMGITQPDMVVVTHKKFGDSLSCAGCGPLHSNSRGLVLVHEAGHYLGLRELWQGGCAGGNTAADCDKKGDLCCDTRPVNANYVCPVPGGNDCSYHLSITDNHENYMDYTGEDCQDNFTADQISLMYATLERYRNSLVSPLNLNRLNLDDCFASAWFMANDVFICDSGSYIFYAIAYDGAVNYHWTIKQGGNTIWNQNTAIDTIVWSINQVGVYDITLTIKYNTNDSHSVTRSAYLEVGSCGSNLASEQGNWYFGDHSGLRFTSSGPVKDIGPFIWSPNINTSEGTVSHSDTLGNLLFYAGGREAGTPAMDVYNRAYQTMPNSPVIGDHSSAQAGAVIQVPGENNLYFLFTVSGRDISNFAGFRYSIIDMSLDGGMGDIATSFKNVPIKATNGLAASIYDSAMLCGEQICIIPNCENGKYWLLVTVSDDIGINHSGKIIIYQLNGSTISLHNITDFHAGSHLQAIKSSPDGNWIFNNGKVYQFDRSNGLLSHYRTLSSDKFTIFGSFSPDSRLLYFLEKNASNSHTSKLIQCSLESENDSLSKTLIAIFPFQETLSSIQLGPDEKIYLTKYGYSSLAKIESPNNQSSFLNPNACSFTLDGPALAVGNIGGKCNIGLPNMMDAKPIDKIIPAIYARDSACGHVSFRASYPCAASYKWLFGDGDSSALENPVHHYTTWGSYTVSLYVDNALYATREITIGIPTPGIAGNKCNLTLNPVFSVGNLNPYLLYEWSAINGTIDHVDNQYNATTSWGSHGKIFLETRNPMNGCVTKDSAVIAPVIVNNSISLDTIACTKGQAYFASGTAQGANYYTWQQSLDGETWGGPLSYAQNRSANINRDSIYLRRIVRNYDFSCLDTSNVIKVYPRFFFSSQPDDDFTCWPHFRPVFEAEFRAPYQDTFNAFWRQLNKDGSVKQNYFQVTGSILDLGGASSSDDSTMVVRIVETSCGTFVSDTARIFYINSRSLTSGLADTTHATEHDTVVLRVSISIPEMETNWQWQYSTNNGGNWEDFPNAQTDSLKLTEPWCHHNRLIRVLATAYCFSPIGDTTRIIVNKQGDIWARDIAIDTGAEPHPYRTIFASPDLFVRNDHTAQIDTIHEDPIYDTAAPKAIYVRARNRGTEYTREAKLYVYWTLFSQGEKWPVNWTENPNNFFWPKASIPLSPYFIPSLSQPYYKGGQINQDPIIIHPLAPGTDTFLKVLWYPPNPLKYYKVVRGNLVESEHLDICLLARILECDDAPYGLSYPEVTSVDTNVRWNNNLITRNTTISNINRIRKKNGIRWTLMQNMGETAEVYDLHYNTYDLAEYFDFGDIYVILDDDALEKWIDGGRLGSGFINQGDTLLKITPGEDFHLKGIELDTGEYVFIGFEHVMYDYDLLLEGRTFMFSLTQFLHDDTTHQYGNAHHIIYIAPDPIMLNSQEVEEDENGQGNNQQDDFLPIDNYTGLSAELAEFQQIVPNPSDGRFALLFGIKSSGTIKVELLTLTGVSLHSSETATLEAGKYQYTYDKTNLSDGMYQLALYHNGIPKVLKLVIAK